MHMSSYLLPFLDTGIDDICIYLSTLTDIPYLDGEKLSMKTFFLVVRGLNPSFDTGSLYLFEDTVLRVLLQLESPKSNHQNSRYVLNNRDYSFFKQN